MTYQEMRENAKKNMAPNCRVCKECNGIVCKGEIPGVGAKGNGGNGFTICIDFLSSVKIKMDTIIKMKVRILQSRCSGVISVSNFCSSSSRNET
ncbi:hypothetical protein [Petroclostridium sp. X23]|uniref:hypothetical protein n=1 Tax=Petroclostridium sp. X23 TaxID=3045146 RepID=UPI0024ACD363|nr:hypothetical protein [Petroclostridium sp. X23]WHH58038.1 hypothetical protein QKW49_19840 [Petroclostridium sp. X23]